MKPEKEDTKQNPINQNESSEVYENHSETNWVVVCRSEIATELEKRRKNENQV